MIVGVNENPLDPALCNRFVSTYNKSSHDWFHFIHGDAICMTRQQWKCYQYHGMWMIESIDFEWHRGRGGGGEKNMFGMRHRLSQFIHYPRLPSHTLTRRPKTPNWTHLHQIPNQHWYHCHRHQCWIRHCWMLRHRNLLDWAEASTSV